MYELAQVVNLITWEIQGKQGWLFCCSLQGRFKDG